MKAFKQKMELDMEELTTLVMAAQGGKRDAFGEIVERFQDMAYAVGYARLGDAHLAEDIAQEAFLEAYINLTKLQEPAAFPGWFRTIVFRQCQRVMRRKQPALVPLEAMMGASTTEPGPMTVAETKDTQEFVHQTIMALPERERQVTLLFYITDYSQKEIADFLGVRVSTVKNRLFSARNHLRERMIEIVQDNLHNTRPSKDTAFAERVMTFIEATEVGDVTKVEVMLDQDPTLANVKGMARFAHEELYPLHNAAIYGFKHIVETLLAKGANINAKSDVGWTPLLGALMTGQQEIVQVLIEHGATIDVFAAAKLGDIDRVRTFIEQDPDLVNAPGPRGSTLLHFAATVPVAAYLLDQGADIHATDGHTNRYRHGTPLSWNADNLEVAQYLISKGAKIDNIYLACALGQVEQVQAFLKADPNLLQAKTGPYRGSLLHAAADKGHVPVAQLLLEHRIEINAKSEEGAVTPLHLAASNGHLEMIRFLMDHGADLAAVDTEFGGTPGGWAKFWQQDEAVALLKEFETAA